MKKDNINSDAVNCVVLSTVETNYLLPAACIEEILHKPDCMLDESSLVLLGTLRWRQKTVPLLDFEQALVTKELARGEMTKAILLKSSFVQREQPVALACFGTITQIEVDGTAVGDRELTDTNAEWVAMSCLYRNQRYLIPAIEPLMKSLSL